MPTLEQRDDLPERPFFVRLLHAPPRASVRDPAALLVDDGGQSLYRLAE